MVNQVQVNMVQTHITYVYTLLCKVLEKIIAIRFLKHYEEISMLMKTRYGFVRNRSTHDYIINLVHEIKKRHSSTRKKCMQYFSIEIEKVYDKIWKHITFCRNLYGWALQDSQYLFLKITWKIVQYRLE